MSQLLYMEQTTFDPVFSSFELPLHRTLYPFGFPLRLETNSEEVISAAVEGWGAFDQTFDAEPVRMCLGVLETIGGALPLDSIIRSREHLMSIVADPNNFLVCDFNSGFAFGWVTQKTVADHPLLRYRFLLAGAATLVEQRAFAVLHGALVARHGKGVMLAGDSFAGKSTLAYACARTGWTYVSDDAAYIVRERADCYAVGDSHSIRFRHDAPELFPELAGRLATVRPNGKIAIEVRTCELKLNTAPGCHIGHVVYLNRVQRSVPATLRSISEDQVLEDWAKYNVFGTEQVREERRRCHERLLDAPLWEMRYSDLDDAVARLDRLVGRGA